MTAVELLHEFQTRDIRLSVDGEQVVYDAPAGAMTAERLALLCQHKAALLTLLTQDAPHAPNVDQAPRIVRSPSLGPETPLEDLQEPAHIWSHILGEAVYVCANQAQAALLRAEGKAAYLPAEIRVLHQLKDRGPATFPEKLRMIHQSKTVFGALVVPAELKDTAR
jgi:hypothetical protein